MEIPVACLDCENTGKIRQSHGVISMLVECPNCAGTGQGLTTRAQKKFVRTVEYSQCAECSGAGKIRERHGLASIIVQCPNCNGEGSAPITYGQAGYIYILYFDNGIYKIGHTTRNPQLRANEWSMKLLAYGCVENSAIVEANIHKDLDRFRMGGYELFKVELEIAIKTIERFSGPIIYL